MGNPHGLLMGEVGLFCEEAKCSRKTLVKVASGRMTIWSVEGERARVVLMKYGRCPPGFLPEERRDRRCVPKVEDWR